MLSTEARLLACSPVFTSRRILQGRAAIVGRRAFTTTMSFKQPPPLSHTAPGKRSQSQESSSAPSTSNLSRLPLSAKALPKVKVYIVEAKIDSLSLAELVRAAEQNAESVCRDPQEADVIITATGMRRRLERHIPWDLAKTKAVVTPQWLLDSIKQGSPLPCENYVAIQDLHDETVAHCPVCNVEPCVCSDSSVESMRETPSRSALRSSSSPTEETKSPPTSPAKKRAKTKDEKSGSEAESSAAPKKRGRPKKDELVAESPIEPAAAVSKSGKKKKDEESAAGTVGTKSPEAEPSSAPSKKGRKKKEPSSDIDATTAATGEPTAEPSAKGKKRKSSTGSKSDAEGKGKKPAPVAPEWHHDGKIDVQLLPPDPPIPTDLSKLDYMAHYACQRASPLKCPNQALVEELDIMRRARLLEGEIRSELSYQKGISALKAYPKKITSSNQVNELPFVGPKIGAMVEEFIESGKIEEAQSHFTSERFKVLTLFSSIYGIGPVHARELFSLGLRTLQDLETYYGVRRQPAGSREGHKFVEVEAAKTKRRSTYQSEGSEELGDNWTRVALELREDFSIKIPRDEVEEIGRVLMTELEELQPGCVSTIVGGYRRGKLESGDVDIVFTHRDPKVVRGLCKRFVTRLREREMVTHVMHLSSFREHNPLRTTHWDSLEKALTVFILPESSPLSKGIRRRLDLIFVPPELYWTAIIGWTGSVMFQRDLRQWAKDKVAMKFDSSGITRRSDSKPFFPRTEKEVFDLFGLEWIDPTWRNADA